MKAIMHFDGACLPINPNGVATYGYVIFAEGKIVEKGSGIAAEKGTNNIAEYTAMIKGMERALELGFDELIVRGDSQLAINQMIGLYAVRSPNIYPLWEKAQKLARRFRKIRFEWVPREQNEVADELSTQAYIEYVERKSVERSREIGEKEITHVSGSVYIVRDYEVNVEERTCTCPYYRRINRYYLLRRSGIKIRCKHIIAAEKYKESNVQR